jgi:hypothetical protein
MSKYYAFGVISAIPEVTLTHWIDVLKTTKQNNHQNNMKNGTFNTIKHIIKKDGILGLNKGFVPRLFGVMPMKFMLWGVYGSSNELLKDSIKNDTYRSILSGIFSGIGLTLIDTPVEVIKVQKIVNNTKLNILSQKCLKLSLQSFRPNLYRNCAFTASFFPIVSYIKKDDDVPFNNLVKGMFAGSIASIISHPFDSIKTDIQSNNIKVSVINKFKEYIVKDYRLLFSGILLRTIHTSCKMGIGYLSISLLCNYF